MGFDTVRAHVVGLIQVLYDEVEGEVDDEDQKVSDDDVFPPPESCTEILLKYFLIHRVNIVFT